MESNVTDQKNYSDITNEETMLPTAQKQRWITPTLAELDFSETQAGGAGFPEGTVGGIPVGIGANS